MKVKDLPKNQPLNDTKVRIPKESMSEAYLSDLYNDEVYIDSVWCFGVWVKTNMESTRTYPLFVDIQDVLEWEVIE